MCGIFGKLFFLITIVVYLEKTFVHTVNIDKDFAIHSKGEDLFSDSQWTSSKTKGRFLGGNSSVAAVLMKSLSITSAIFTIWIFAETRKNPDNNRPVSNEQFEDLNDHVEYLNIQIQNVQHSLLQLTCLFGGFPAQAKNKPVKISPECLQFIQKHKHAETFAPILAKTSRFITNYHIENNNS